MYIIIAKAALAALILLMTWLSNERILVMVSPKYLTLEEGSMLVPSMFSESPLINLRLGLRGFTSSKTDLSGLILIFQLF